MQLQLIKILGSILVFVSLILGAAWYGYHKGETDTTNKYKAEQLERIQSENKATNILNSGISGVAKTLESKKAKQEAFKGKKNDEKEITTSPGYSAPVPSSGVSALSDTATKLNQLRSAGELTEEVPRD